MRVWIHLFFFFFFAFPAFTHAEESKLKAALAFRTHARKALEIQTHLNQITSRLEQARLALQKDRWQTIGGYLEDVSQGLQKVEHLFPSSSAAHKLRAAQTLYEEKKYAQAAAVLELLSEEERWLGYYKEISGLKEDLARLQKYLIKQNTPQFEQALTQILRKVTLPDVDPALNQLQAEVYLCLASWKKENKEELAVHLEKAQKEHTQFFLLLNLAQARQDLARSESLSQNKMQDKKAKRAFKRAVKGLAKLKQAQPQNALLQECFEASTAIKQNWSKKGTNKKETLQNLVQKTDSALDQLSRASAQ